MKVGSEFIGKYRSANVRFGFVEINDEGSNFEIYVETKSKDLFVVDGDDVLVKITDLPLNDKHCVGKIIKIINRNTTFVVGTVQKNKDIYFVRPDNKKISFDIHIDKKLTKSVENNYKVLCKILKYPKQKNISPEGAIIEIYGHKNEPNAQIKSILARFSIPDEFTLDEINEARRLNDNIPNGNNINDRIDLRNLTTFTIDSESAKDLDDAISLKINTSGNYILYVHIADVANYIKEGTVLDKEALLRGNSVYLLDRVVPMLPFSLSNGACSLNQKEDRWALTCEMEFDTNGKIITHNIYESIICVNMRMSYNGVQAVFDNNLENYNEYEQYTDILLEMRKLASILNSNRKKLGSIDFNIKETMVVVDENLKPIEIKEVERGEAHKLIEEFMLAANRTVAEDFYNRTIPFIYRTHEPPDDEKLKSIILFMKNLCYNTPKSFKNIKSKDVQNLLDMISNTEHESIISRMLLRSMKQAKYTTSAIGHFGLAFKYYTHFTSPIRRYSDLIVHRLIKEVLHGELDINRITHYQNILDEIAESISNSERKAIAAERDLIALKECEYLMPHIGEVFDATIVSIMNYGFYVALDNTIEGLVAFKNFDTFVYFDEKNMIAVDKSNSVEYRIGDNVKVLLLGVDVTFREIDFAIAKEND